LYKLRMTSGYYETQQWYVEGYGEELARFADTVGQVATSDGHSSAIYRPHAPDGVRFSYNDGFPQPRPEQQPEPLSPAEHQLLIDYYKEDFAKRKQGTLDSLTTLHGHLTDYVLATTQRELDYSVARQQSLQRYSSALGGLVVARRTLYSASADFPSAIAYSLASHGWALQHEYHVVALDEEPALVVHNLSTPHDRLQDSARLYFSGPDAARLLDPILDGTIADPSRIEADVDELLVPLRDDPLRYHNAQGIAGLLRSRGVIASYQRELLRQEGPTPPIENIIGLTEALQQDL
jgi:hypothetical protein